MNLVPLDPDLKVNMSLDEIIHLSKPVIDSQLNKKFFGRTKKRRNRRKNQSSTMEHSVPLMSSLGGGYIMVTKKSPLLSAANKRKIANAVSNRQINSELIENAKEIIPARYKLVKTDCGVERVLVPAEGVLPNTKKILNKVLPHPKPLHPSPVIQPPRPLNPPPPPINFLNYYQNNTPVEENIKMEIDEDENEIEILEIEEVTTKKPNPPIINIDNDVFGNNPNDFRNIAAAAQKPAMRTLNDRFTELGSCVRF